MQQKSQNQRTVPDAKEIKGIWPFLMHFDKMQKCDTDRDVFCLNLQVLGLLGTVKRSKRHKFCYLWLHAKEEFEFSRHYQRMFWSGYTLAYNGCSGAAINGGKIQIPILPAVKVNKMSVFLYLLTVKYEESNRFLPFMYNHILIFKDRIKLLIQFNYFESMKLFQFCILYNYSGFSI